MRRTIKLFALAAVVAVFAAPAFAQAKECNEENKAAWYQTFLENFRKEPPQQKVAYEAAKAYLDSCPADPNDQQATYMREKFVKPYEAMTGAANIGKQFEDAVKNNKYADQVRIGKQIVAGDPDGSKPDTVKVYILMGVAGLPDPTVLADSAEAAKKAIQLIEVGKPFAPLFEGNKDKALANLNYAIAKASLKSSPADAIPLLLKTAKYESEQKKNWQLYYDLASAYAQGPRAKLTEEYKSKIAPDGTETPESKLVLANLNQIIDRQIDALARAEALSDAANKKSILDELTELYKFRNKSDAGLNEMVAGILSKPLPEFPQPITSLPSTSTTGGSPSGNNGTTQPGTTGGTKPAGNTGPTGTASGTQTTKTGPGTKPAATPTPKPPRRSNHRRR